MGLCRPPFDLDDRRCTPTYLSPARNVQRAALARACWCLLAHAAARFAPWEVVYQQTQRWIRTGCFEAIVHDLRELLCLAQGRKAQPTGAIFVGRTLQSTPESGGRAGYDGHKRKRGLEGAHGGRHVGTFVGAVGHARQRAGAGAGGGLGAKCVSRARAPGRSSPTRAHPGHASTRVPTYSVL